MDRVRWLWEFCRAGHDIQKWFTLQDRDVLSRRLFSVSHTPSVADAASSPARKIKVLEMTTPASIRHQSADSQSPSPHTMVLLATQQQRRTQSGLFCAESLALTRTKRQFRQGSKLQSRGQMSPLRSTWMHAPPIFRCQGLTEEALAAILRS